MGDHLAALIAPLSVAAFRARHAPEVREFQHLRDGGAARLRLFDSLPMLASARAMFDAWTQRVTVVLPDRDDQHSSLALGAADARRLYENGIGGFFGQAEESIPALRPWLHGLAADLGFPSKARKLCLVYVSPDGEGASTHFDQNLNVIVQLRGSKRWWVAPNRNVALPTTRYALNMDDVPAELAEYSELPLTADMYVDATEVVLEPGDLLVLPRGSWHRTIAIGESLSLNFTFSPLTWGELVCDSLLRQLHRTEAWRELATDLGSIALARRLATATEQLQRLAPHELIVTACGHRYRVMPGTRIVVADDSARVVRDDDPDEPMEIDADPEIRPLLAWIGSRGEPFTADELIRAFPGAREIGAGLFRSLIAAEILTTE